MSRSSLQSKKKKNRHHSTNDSYKMKSFLIVLIALFVLKKYSTEITDNRARFDNYRIYQVTLGTEKHVNIFKEVEKRSDSYDFYGHPRKIGQQIIIMIASHKIAEMTDILETFNIQHKVLSYNFQEKIDAQEKFILPKDSSPEKYDWNHYFHLETIYAWLDKLAEKYEHIKVLDMGNSYEGVPIKGVKITNNPIRPTIFIEGGIHAREWISPAAATFIINQTLTDDRTKDFNWIVFPVLNVDGYKYSFESDRMWRKNRNIFGSCRGVDLNRNYPFHWNEAGSSSEPCRYDYAGPSEASEAETERLITFIKNHVQSDKIMTYIALHSYSQLIMFPYGYSAEKVENYDDLMKIAGKASAAIEKLSGKKYRFGSIYETIYPSSGGSKDWAHAIAKIPITFTFELRGTPDSPDLFILPAEEITPTAEEVYAALLEILLEASQLGYY